jgi:hypothetical protein
MFLSSPDLSRLMEKKTLFFSSNYLGPETERNRETSCAQHQQGSHGDAGGEHPTREEKYAMPLYVCPIPLREGEGGSCSLQTLSF